MVDWPERLVDALAEETRLQRELLNAGVQKRKALVSWDMAAVERATVLEHQAASALASAAERRLRVTHESARRLGLAEGEASASRVAESAAEPARARLLGCVGALRRAAAEVARVNRTNKALTEQSLKHVQFFFRTLGGPAGEVTYSRRGVAARPECGKVLIDRVA